jgi:isorenieratene synthase
MREQADCFRPSTAAAIPGDQRRRFSERYHVHVFPGEPVAGVESGGAGELRKRAGAFTCRRKRLNTIGAMTPRPEKGRHEARSESVMIVVVGAGLAGLTAAIHLAERGLPVVLCEAHPSFLGGRTRAREPYRFRFRGEDHVQSFDHGQHCMWTQYWNMKALLARLGIFQRAVRPCATTRYLYDDGDTVHRLAPFNVDPEDEHPTFFHFAAHMARSMRMPGWSASDSLRLLGALPKLAAMTSFAHGRNFDEWDRLSVDEMFAWVGLPLQLEQAFKSMCKASTFHAHSEISASWGLSMVESTMIGHPDDHKMWCFRGNLGEYLIDPLAEALRKRGGRIVKNARAVGVERRQGRIVAVHVEPTTAADPGQREVLLGLERLPCDAVVAATDIPGFQRWLLPSLADVDEIRATANLDAVGSVCARLVCARPVRGEDAPMGIFTGRFRMLDTYFRLSRYQDEFAAFRDRTGGEVLELHAYMASRELSACSAETARHLVEQDALRAWPELDGNVVHVEVAVNERTFDRQGVGHRRFQPGPRTSVPNLVLCGSWIRTDDAVHDMEKAVVTGLRAANLLLEERGCDAFPVASLRSPSPLQRVARLLRPALPRPSAVRRAALDSCT